MNGDELQRLSETVVSKTIPVYTVARNEIQLLRNHPPPLIINSNTMDIDSDGAHWLCFWVLSEKGLGQSRSVVQYYDSFAEKITKYGISSPWPIVKYNTQAHQPMHSEFCGRYVIFFSAKRACNLGFDAVMSLFDKRNLNYNDIKVSRVYEQVLICAKTKPAFTYAWCPTMCCRSRKEALKLTL